MLKKFKSLSGDKKRLVGNFFSLSVLQGANYLLPLITLPYLIRVLGPDRFGLIIFAQAFLQYFVVFTDYGFNLSATREISVHRNDMQKVSEIFSSVMVIKVLLMLLSFLILGAVVLAFAKFKSNWQVYALTAGIVPGYVLFPLWFFQGVEKMKYITLINFLAKLIFTVSIFVFIRKSDDYIFVPLLNSLGYLVAGILSQWIVLRHFNIRYRIPSLLDIISHLRAGWHIFISTISISFYKANSIFILGLFASEAVVGYFAVIKKLIDAATQFAAIISQTIYPYVSKKIRTSFDEGVVFLKKSGALIFGYTFLVGMGFLFFAEIIVSLITGSAYTESVQSLRIMAFVPLIIGVNVPAVMILLGKGLDKEFSEILLIGAVLDIALNFILVPSFSYIGSSISVIIAESFVTLGLYGMVFRRYSFKRILHGGLSSD